MMKTLILFTSICLIFSITGCRSYEMNDEDKNWIEANWKNIEPSDDLLDAIAEVASGNRSDKVDKWGERIGMFQLTKKYVDEVNEIIKKENMWRVKLFQYSDRQWTYSSRQMVKIYLTYWGNRIAKDCAKKKENIIVDDKLFALIQYCGPSEYKRDSSSANEYIMKIKEVY